MAITKRDNLTPELEPWETVNEDLQCSGLLIGNGCSRAVWESFSYESLYEIVSNENVDHRLTSAETLIFEELNTKNFEQILSALSISIRVMSALKKKTDHLQTKYSHIQDALVEAVRTRHIPWHKVADSQVLSKLSDALDFYSYVYSTNYDLLVYWAINQGNRYRFKDFFWSGSQFDLANTEAWGKATLILFLHGGLHLRKTADGGTMKTIRTSTGGSILEHFDTDVKSIPLFIAEGTSADKLRSIHRSDYLAFAYSQLAHHTGPLCIFGHSLKDQDEHLVAAIKRARVRDLAYSVRPYSDGNKIKSTKAAIFEKFPEANLRFFDASTHPLGDPVLRIEVPS